MYQLRGHGDVEVVGESFHEAALISALHSHIEGELETAILIPEPEKPNDPHAVRVELIGGGQRYHIGYLPRDQARLYQPVLLDLARDQKYGCVGAKIWRGTSTTQVYLRLDEPDRIIGPLAPVDHGEVLDGEWATSVSGKKDYQPLLAVAASGASPHEDFFSLHPSTIEKGKDAGAECFEVRLRDQPIGNLTAMVSTRYAADIQKIIDAGKVAFAQGVITRDNAGVYSITLEMPAHR